MLRRASRRLARELQQTLREQQSLRHYETSSTASAAATSAPGSTWSGAVAARVAAGTEASTSGRSSSVLRGMLPPSLAAMLSNASKSSHRGFSRASTVVRQQQQRHQAAAAAAVRRWQQLEARTVTLVNSLFCSPAGQKLLVVGIPLIASELWASASRGGGESSCLSTDGPVHGLQLAHVELPYAFTSLRGLVNVVVEEFLTALRGVYLALLFMPVLFTTPVILLADWERERWLELVRWTLERAGPAFIKWGQWAATRPDLFPPDLCTELEKLQAGAPAHTYNYTVKAVEGAFGCPLHAIFTDFSKEPVASGSIAQVYRATLSEAGAEGTGLAPGTVVAVKVRHPGVQNAMHRDFALMQAAAWVSSRIPGLADLQLDESIRQFGAPLKEQLDLVREAKHLARFNHNFRRWTSLSFPRPVFPLVSPDVLVESYEEGHLISTYVKNPGQHTKPLADLGMNCYLKMLLKDNFVHADLHPGNILVRYSEPTTAIERLGRLLRRGGGRDLRIPHLVLLDTGMIAELSARDKDNLLGFFKAVAVKDGTALGRRILSFSERQSCTNPDAFVAEMTQLMDSLTPEEITKNTSEVIGEVMERVRKHGVALKGSVSTIVVTTLVLEGWSTKLNPDIKIMDSLRELLPMKWSERISQTADRIITRHLLPATA